MKRPNERKRKRANERIERNQMKSRSIVSRARTTETNEWQEENKRKKIIQRIRRRQCERNSAEAKGVRRKGYRERETKMGLAERDGDRERGTEKAVEGESTRDYIYCWIHRKTNRNADFSHSFHTKAKTHLRYYTVRILWATCVK